MISHIVKPSNAQIENEEGLHCRSFDSHYIQRTNRSVSAFREFRGLSITRWGISREGDVIVLNGEDVAESWGRLRRILRSAGWWTMTPKRRRNDTGSTWPVIRPPAPSSPNYTAHSALASARGCKKRQKAQTYHRVVISPALYEMLFFILYTYIYIYFLLLFRIKTARRSAFMLPTVMVLWLTLIGTAIF